MDECDRELCVCVWYACVCMHVINRRAYGKCGISTVSISSGSSSMEEHMVVTCHSSAVLNLSACYHKLSAANTPIATLQASSIKMMYVCASCHQWQSIWLLPVALELY